ncbi:MAG: hypothetical protein IPN15_11090 [Saprospiraceae bacterium]|nr:hypothetical protein [Candidatus Vicinibacter affinis]
MKTNRNYLLIYLLCTFFWMACQKEDKIPYTNNCNLPGGDSSALHPKAILYQSILDKYVKKQ